MRPYFARTGLLLHKNPDGKFVLEIARKELGRLAQEKKAVAAYNKIRGALEKEMPPTQITDAERLELLQKYLSDSLVGHNLWLEPKKQLPTLRIQHS